MRFELKKTLRGRSDEELLQLICDCAEKLGQETVTIEQYNEHGIGHATTAIRRFGSWPVALEKAGLPPTRSKLNIPEHDLFQNLLELWLHLGRQPTYRDVDSPESQYSAKVYANRFSSWTKALERFVEWANQDTVDAALLSQNQAAPTDQTNSSRTRNRRDPTLRQRFIVLQRDSFSCRSCGASPSKNPDVELEVDHIIPWSKGGPTEDDNLETKCKKCNLGKGNAFEA